MTTDTLFVRFDPADDTWPAGVVWREGAAWVDTKTGPVMVRAGDWVVTDPDDSRRVVADEPAAKPPHFVLEVQDVTIKVQGVFRNG